MIRLLRMVLALCVLLLAGLLRPAAEPALVTFTPEETDMILAHGPWPVPWQRDASNRVSGRPEAIAFGRRLFFDTRLSATGTVSCATCHQPDRFWTDGRPLGRALAEVDRNTPTLANVRLNRWFGWDGANDNLWAQSFRPLLDPRELGATEGKIAEAIRNQADLLCGYRRAFGEEPPADDERLVVDVGKALAAFAETLVTGRTSFDDFRDALARGDRAGAAAYPAAAQRGLKIFVGRGRCSLCHFGPNFTHGEFHEIGIPIYRKAGGVDWGRYQGIKLLRASRFNLLGAFNDDPRRAQGAPTRYVDLLPQTFEQFRVPSLRNVALTAPYMHNGHFASLAEIVRHYSEIDPGKLHVAHVYFTDGTPEDGDPPPADTTLRPLHLSAQEIADVVAFLETLTEKAPAPPAADSEACPAPSRSARGGS
ncbi:MAG TPA: cytochrome c peroxidase [Xanthobacteraceae bacterium]|nr:cytochrome c peroxidase [Xanthobacteraceae bacterium]